MWIYTTCRISNKFCFSTSIAPTFELGVKFKRRAGGLRFPPAVWIVSLAHASKWSRIERRQEAGVVYAEPGSIPGARVGFSFHPFFMSVEKRKSLSVAQALIRCCSTNINPDAGSAKELRIRGCSVRYTAVLNILSSFHLRNSRTRFDSRHPHLGIQNPFARISGGWHVIPKSYRPVLRITLDSDSSRNRSRVWKIFMPTQGQSQREIKVGDEVDIRAMLRGDSEQWSNNFEREGTVSLLDFNARWESASDSKIIALCAFVNVAGHANSRTQFDSRCPQIVP
ncbi:hypothetical protein B0H17DRAFT_1142392 [Mycena rosella]|uniref:Uncharacterized protein n=1 Tax=Mycena rosella TaxID=1033263 RepID=A0AAD7CXF0_MYCRO|nr:hypothetical protein B0H17DRAFT_1142392 [Mycena rosella]